tara:strand:+ start:961 stop:1218 length:258 start_codon:yes stop_codon:yes gene_type:complete
MEKEYDIKDKVYFVQWDNIAGLYTYKELKKEYGDTNLFDKPLNISFFSNNIELDTIEKVIEFLSNDDEIYSRHFIADNMRICRVY